MLCQAGQVCFSTEDHTPYSPLERERIESAGGSVSLQRINGSLAVSRALGDFSYKGAENRPPTQQMVSPEPEVCVVERSPGDEFLVLACDGVWDTVSNEELCAFIQSRLRVCTDLRDVCSQVIDLCLYKVSTHGHRSPVDQCMWTTSVTFINNPYMYMLEHKCINSLSKCGCTFLNVDRATFSDLVKRATRTCC